MIKNVSSGAVLAEHTRLVVGLFAQAFGLMFRSRLSDTGWVFLLPKTSRWHVTNVFVFQTITVLWLDAQKRVLQKRVVKPFAPHVAGISQTAFLIELSHTVADKVRVGDRILWSESKRI